MRLSTKKYSSHSGLNTITGFFCFFVLPVFILTGCASVSVEQHKESDYNYKVGVTYLNEGKIQPAFVQFQKALQIDPDNKDALHSLGLVYFELEEYEKARELFLKTVSLKPEFSDAYNNLGATYMKMGQWREAIEAFKKALVNQLYQNPERAYYNLGMSYYRTGQYDPAINEFKLAMKRDQNFMHSYYGMALAFNKAGRYGDAAAMMSRAIEIDPAYRGNKSKFREDINQRILTTRGEEETDLRDYLEILRY